ncbi:MAG TPA: FAD-binding oxidoreductase [Dehalococcoidales bacterium]|nr:FAD-binding oxidoreductase [Dehalococcoidales bacterium]
MAAYRHWSPQNARKPVSPGAVIMPASTEEVCGIVKICNQYRLPYCPQASLFGAVPTSTPGMLLINLRRMNKILEINEIDRYAVIEPAVRHVQLKPELLKRGLNYPTASVGPSCSVLANFVASGDHHVQHSFSRVSRYIQGFEWVLPTGVVLRVGSLANDSGWFCADGPGPSLRGLLRGWNGWGGGMGIITKMAIGLEVWNGPPVLTVSGHSPRYKIPLPLETHRIHIFKFPSLDKVRDAMLEIGRAEIGFAVLKFFYATEAVMYTESANDFFTLWESGLYQKELQNALWVCLACRNPKELEYEERVLEDIMAETGGEPVEESIRKKYEENADFFIMVSFLQRVLKLGGGWSPAKLGGESIHHLFEAAKAIPEYFDEFIKKQEILNAPHNFQIIPMEYGHLAHIELLFFYDRNIPERRMVPMAISQKSLESDIRHGFHAATPFLAPGMIEKYGPLWGNYFRWAAEIKKIFDPNNVSNPSRQ